MRNLSGTQGSSNAIAHHRLHPTFPHRQGELGGSEEIWEILQATELLESVKMLLLGPPFQQCTWAEHPEPISQQCMVFTGAVVRHSAFL